MYVGIQYSGWRVEVIVEKQMRIGILYENDIYDLEI